MVRGDAHPDDDVGHDPPVHLGIDGRGLGTSGRTSPTGSTGAPGILYSVRTFDQDSSLATEAGYDQVTGVGARAFGFAAAIAGP